LRLALLVDLPPNVVGSLSNTSLFDQLACHGTHHVGILFNTGEAFAAELAFHHH
jgi:hypothetical protein